MMEKALMVDCGRKFFSKAWFLQVIDYLQEIGLDTLQLHFSDFLGFRIEPEQYPEIVSEEHLTKEEVREIIAYAKERQIQIIPDFDTPGHLTQILKFYPQFRLEKEIGGNRVPEDHALDISNPDAVAFIKSIYGEYAELFKDSKYFHIGADEFIEFDKVADYPDLVADAKAKYGEEATGMEVYVAYTNEIIDYICSLGFIPRVWNDGFYRTDRHSLVELDKRAQITYWTKWHQNMAEVGVFLDKGYEVINYCDNFFYYVLGEAAGYTYPTADKIRTDWDVNLFPHHQRVGPEQKHQVVGTSFAVWCDIPGAQTEAEVFEGIKGPLKAMADKLKEAE